MPVNSMGQTTNFMERVMLFSLCTLFTCRRLSHTAGRLCALSFHIWTVFYILNSPIANPPSKIRTRPQLKFLIIFLLKPVHFRNVPGMGLGDACLGKGIQSGVVSG